ncbi:MAG TPA: VOC family protein [Ilumatobacteraceae bacterium]|nr:VOC family protein [Ilumatobacteraceae bacterium]
MSNWIDHLVLAAPSLEVGIEHVRQLTGTAPIFGGRHEGAGTHNALMSLGAPTYLEVLAPDPSQPPPSALIEPGRLTEAHLHGFAIGCNDLEAAVRDLREAGVEGVTDPFAMTRRQPDGTELAWQLAFIGPNVEGARPFLISWGDTPSPAYTGAVGGQFVALRAGDPDPTAAAVPLAVLGIDVEVDASPTPWLRATIHTPSGTVELT